MRAAARPTLISAAALLSPKTLPRQLCSLAGVPPPPLNTMCEFFACTTIGDAEGHEGPTLTLQGSQLICVHLGAHLAQCARSATIWVCDCNKDPYFVILGALWLFESRF